MNITYISHRCLQLSDDVAYMTDALCELRSKGEGTSPQAETLARNIEARLNELCQTVSQAVNRVEKSGIQQPSPTVSGRLEQGLYFLYVVTKRVL